MAGSAQKSCAENPADKSDESLDLLSFSPTTHEDFPQQRDCWSFSQHIANYPFSPIRLHENPTVYPGSRHRPVRQFLPDSHSRRSHDDEALCALPASQ